MPEKRPSPPIPFAVFSPSSTFVRVPPEQAVRRRCAVQKVVAEPFQYRDREGGRGGEETDGELSNWWRLLGNFGESLRASAVLMPGRVAWIGEEDTDAFDNDRPARHPHVVLAERKGLVHQVDLKRIVYARVVTEIDQGIRPVLHMPGIVPEEAGTKILQSPAVGACPRPLTVQEMPLETEKAEDPVVRSQGTDGFAVEGGRFCEHRSVVWPSPAAMHGFDGPVPPDFDD
jgi:hypothetical protein